MKRRFERHRLKPVLIALLLLATWTSRAFATTLTFPSPSCSAGLQACIDTASPGDIVEVATAGPIGESLTIDKSLTLRPAAGFSPVIDSGARVTLVNLTPSANSIVFEGFTITSGDVRAIQFSTQPFDVRIRNLVFTDTNIDRAPIDVGTGIGGSYGPVKFDIADNAITIPDSINTVDAIIVNGGYASTFKGVIHGNSIVDLAGVQGGGIVVANAVSQLDVEVIGNKITGTNFNSGVSLFQFGDGTSNVRFINNLVEGQVSEAGQPAAIAIGVTGGNASFLVANNTLVNSDEGISVSGRDDLGATWNGIVANNIVANISGSGVTIDNPFSSVVNENNLVFNTGGNFFTPGPGTLFVDPQFVGSGDYRLNLASPARDAGNSARVPADILLDLSGLPRIQGARVDIGTYETVPEPSTSVMLLPIVLTALYRRHMHSRSCRS